MSGDDRELHRIVVTAPPGAGKTKLMAELLIRYRLEMPGSHIFIDGFR
jgi:hypothetical protein